MAWLGRTVTLCGLEIVPAMNVVMHPAVMDAVLLNSKRAAESLARRCRLAVCSIWDINRGFWKHVA